MREDIGRLVAAGSIGVELGVATGQFSQRLLDTGRFAVLYSIDAWNDRGHNGAEHFSAIKRLKPYGDRSVIIRARFDEAVKQFDDGFFDFIYIDGYADTGQENGQTLRDWWPKVKEGGLFGGDDYHPKYPLVQSEVNRFLDEVGHELHIHTFDSRYENVWGRCPSWYTWK